MRTHQFLPNSNLPHLLTVSMNSSTFFHKNLMFSHGQLLLYQNPVTLCLWKLYDGFKKNSLTPLIPSQALKEKLLINNNKTMSIIVFKIVPGRFQQQHYCCFPNPSQYGQDSQRRSNLLCSGVLLKSTCCQQPPSLPHRNSTTSATPQVTEIQKSHKV